uniref:P27 n=1 Tax=Arracacha latent virus C TaxID=2057938 RepID=A0A3S7H5M4_9CLOS|nr:hypothetical protein [Arracacha latent virus C]
MSIRLREEEMDNFPIIQDFSHQNVNDGTDRIAYNVNLVLNTAIDHNLHDVFSLEKTLVFCHTLKNLFNVKDVRVNLFSRNSKVYEMLVNSGYPESEILDNKDKYFPTLTSWQLITILENLIPIFDLLVDCKRGLIDNVALIHIFDNYLINDITGLNWALSSYLCYKYRFISETNVEFSLDIEDERLLQSHIYKYKIYYKNSSKKKRDFTKILNENLRFRVKLDFNSMGLSVPYVKNF